MKTQELDDTFATHFAGKRVRVEIPDVDADYWLTALPKYQTMYEATKKTDRMPVAKPITGIRRLLIKWRLKRQYWAELKAAN